MFKELKQLLNRFLIWSYDRNMTRAPHAGDNAWLQLLLENSKSERGHNYETNFENYLPYISILESWNFGSCISSFFPISTTLLQKDVKRAKTVFLKILN